MMAHLSEADLRRYLLQDLRDSEQTEVEDELFTQESATEQLFRAEAELIDAYVTNELSQRDRTLFETRFVTSSRRAERVKTAELLLSRAAASKPASTARSRTSLGAMADLFRLPYARPLVALGFVFVCAVSSVVSIFVSSSVLRREIARSTAAPTNKTVGKHEEAPAQQQTYVTKSELDQVMAELRDRQNRASEKPLFAFVLAPSAVRSTHSAQQLVVPRGSSAVKLQLTIIGDANYRTYRAVLRDTDQNQIWSGTVDGRRAADTRTAEFVAPASALAPGEYTVELAGDPGSGSFESVQEYFFSVVRK
jgi:hypothetical protein